MHSVTGLGWSGQPANYNLFMALLNTSNYDLFMVLLTNYNLFMALLNMLGKFVQLVYGST